MQKLSSVTFSCLFALCTFEPCNIMSLSSITQCICFSFLCFQPATWEYLRFSYHCSPVRFFTPSGFYLTIMSPSHLFSIPTSTFTSTTFFQYQNHCIFLIILFAFPIAPISFGEKMTGNTHSVWDIGKTVHNDDFCFLFLYVVRFVFAFWLQPNTKSALSKVYTSLP